MRIYRTPEARFEGLPDWPYAPNYLEIESGLRVHYVDEGAVDAQPVLIRAGTLGQGLPTEDILVSPHQKVSVQTTNYSSELRLARDLLGRPGILRQPQSMLTYYMFHCGQPAKVSAEGVALYTAP